MNTKLTGIKNLIWTLFIVIALIAVVVGLFSAVFTKYYGGKQDYAMGLGNNVVAPAGKGENTAAEIGTGSGISRGELKQLAQTEDAGADYISSTIFLCDSTFIGLRDLAVVDTSQVWGSSSGSLPIKSILDSTIKFPNDGSEISPENAAMVIKPKILVIAIGTDELADTDEETFIGNYNTLIRNIRLASPDTQIVCCGLPSISEEYSGRDGLTVTIMSDGNDWIKLVCRDTGAYFLDVQEALSESVQLLARFASSNGRSLNRNGLQTFLEYFRTHAVPSI